MAGNKLWSSAWEDLSCPLQGNLKCKGHPYWEGLFSEDFPDPGLIYKDLLQIIKKNHVIEKWAKDVKGIHQRNAYRKLFIFIIIF